VMGKRRRIKPFAQVFLKLIAESFLNAACFSESGSLDPLDVGRDGDPANFSGQRRPVTLEPPLRHNSIGGKISLNAAGRAIEVWVVTFDDDAQLLEIEICVLRLQWIECPLDQLDSMLQRMIPLRHFQEHACSFVPEPMRHDEHMGVPIRSSISHRWNGTEKSDKFLAF